jgi:hypothetical protein
MSNQPRWQAWLMHRTLNKTFKEAIEDYYIEFYLKSMGIMVDCEGWLQLLELGADWDSYSIVESYLFNGFAGPEQRMAVIKTTDDKTRKFAWEFEVCFSLMGRLCVSCLTLPSVSNTGNIIYVYRTGLPPIHHD